MSEKIQIVCYIRGWIVEAIARQWGSLIREKMPHAEVTLEFRYPKPGADTYIHFIYLNAIIVPGARNIVYVTHIDRWWKAFRLISLSKAGVEFVTASGQTRELLKSYTGSKLAVCVNPASIHFDGEKQKGRFLTFGLFFKLYKDGRKVSTKLLKQLFDFANQRPELCRVVLFGGGWKEQLSGFPNVSALVLDDEFSPGQYEQALRKCDYVLYFGRDEGAMSVVDAAALNIPVLATAQGFHEDIALAKGSQLFECADEIMATVTLLCNAVRDSKYSTDPSTVLSVHPPESEYHPSAWRYIMVPFIKNRSLLRKGNLTGTVAYLHKRFAKGRLRRSHTLMNRLPSNLPRASPKTGSSVEVNQAGWTSAKTAIQINATAIKADPEQAEPYNNLGLALSELNLHKFAIFNYEKAIALKPDFAEARVNLAKSLEILNQQKLVQHSCAISTGECESEMK